ncbi:hypothetical protein HY994_05765 [Candidatus Micrarchaeota archaeon]|nr:hypothetical protein [Candidatus Micrarchaeota archaeon]
MGFLMELLGHAVMHRQKENLKKMHDQLDVHHQAHRDEKKAQQRAILAQAHLERLHAAVKLHAFHQQLSGQMKTLTTQKQFQDRQRLQGLVTKISRVESGQTDLRNAMSKKADAHQDVEKRLLSLKSDVDDALKELNKIKR